MENITYKLYSPLTAEHLPDTDVYWREDAIFPLRGRDLTDYAAVIAEQIEREGANLEQYLDHEDVPYLAAHVKSIRLSVEERDGELCGCATVVADEELEQEGWYELYEYLTGQYSDGWGEGFEQRNIPVAGGVLNVHFWQPARFYFKDEQVQPAPQEELLSATNDGRSAEAQMSLSAAQEKRNLNEICSTAINRAEELNAARIMEQREKGPPVQE